MILRARSSSCCSQRACNALSLANKAGLVVAGFTKAEKVVAQGEAIALIHAADAADDGRGQARPEIPGNSR